MDSNARVNIGVQRFDKLIEQKKFYIDKTRYQLGEQIRRSVIIRSLNQTIETLKSNLSIRKAFQELICRCG